MGFDDLQDADEFAERYRQAQRTHGWKVVGAGLLAIGIGVLEVASPQATLYFYRGYILLLAGTLALMVGVGMVYRHRRRKLPRAQVRRASRGRRAS